MAEVTGELGGQPIILENAATETTLQLLVQAVNAANPNKGKAAQVQKMYEEALAKTVKSKAKELKALQEEEKAREDLNKALEKEKERRKQLLEDLQGLSEVIGKGIGMAFATATPKISDFTDALSGIPLVGPIFAAFGRASQAQVDAFRQLSSTGADLGGSLAQVRSSAAAAGLSLDDYVDVVTKNSEAFARLGGSVSTGTRIFREISGAIQSNFGRQLANLGYTIGEVSEFSAGYLDIQTKLSRAQKMSQTELINGSHEYLLELDQLSRVTGMSRKEAQDALKQQLADKRVRSVMAGMDDRTRKEYQKTLAALEKQSPELAEAFKELVATGGVPFTDLGKSVALANPEFVRAAAAFKTNTGNFNDLAGTVRQGARTFDGMDQGFKDLAATTFVLGKTTGTAGFMIFQGADKFGEGIEIVTEEQRKAQEATNRGMLLFDRALLNIRNMFMRALAPALGYFEKESSKIMVKLSGYATRFGQWIESLVQIAEGPGGIKGAFVQAIKDMMKHAIPILGEVLFDLFTNPLVVTSLAAAIGTAAFLAGAAAKVGSATTGAIGSVGGRVLDSVFGGGERDGTSKRGPARDPKTGRFTKRGTTAPEQPGAGLLGGLAEGVLTGVANGLSAFANPKILLGATILSGAIVVIGGAIAGASWLMGKSLPTLAEGMKSVEQLDGEKLQSAGLGIAAVGAGLLAFGAGGTIGSITSAFGSFVDTVAGFFGAKSPIEKLKEFAVVGNDLGKSAEGYKAFKLAITDMPLSNLSFTDKQLENLDIGTAKIRRLSSSLTKVREEMKAISSPSITETVTSAIKDIGQAITAKLGGKEDKEATVESLMTDLNSKVDLLNSNMAVLVNINQNMAPDMRKTARNTKAASGAV